MYLQLVYIYASLLFTHIYGMNFRLRARKKNNFSIVLMLKKKYIEPLKIYSTPLTMLIYKHALHTLYIFHTCALRGPKTQSYPPPICYTLKRREMVL